MIKKAAKTVKKEKPKKLKKSEVEVFKLKLEQIRLQLMRTVKGTSDEVKSFDESAGYSQHQADEGTDDFDRTINLEVTSKEYAVLKQVDRALKKIEDGTYGVCDLSGEIIPMKRLEAVPYATMTVEAQEKLEKGLL